MQTGENTVFAIPSDSKPLLNAARKAHMAYRRARNSDIDAYRIAEDGPWLLYVENAPSFASLPAEVKKHLTHHKAALMSRKAFERGNCDWWRYTWPLHKDYFTRPRIYAPYRARDNRFAVDADKVFLGITDTTVLYDNDQPEDLRYIAAVLNSKVLTYRFRFIGKLVGGGNYEYFHNTISKLPVPRMTPGDPDHDALADLYTTVSDLKIDLSTTLVPAERRRAQRDIERAIAAIDTIVYRIYGLTKAEVDVVEQYLSQ